MKKKDNYQNFIQKFFYWSGVIFLALLMAFMLDGSSAWVEPVNDGNILSPLNSGPLPQSKLGGLILNIAGYPYGLIVDKGLVGIGTTSPKGALDVTSTTAGFVPPRMTTANRDAILSPEAGMMIFNTDTKRFNGFNGNSWDVMGKVESTPVGTIAFFDLSDCPSGWSEVTNARGRYIVGNPAGGNIGSTVGSALSNQENRPIGQHSHSAWQDAHNHTATFLVPNNGGVFQGWGWSTERTRETSYAQPPVYVSNEGAVSGTNAPYIQFLACKKN